MNLIKLFKKYDRTLKAYHKGYIDDHQKNTILTDLFSQSGYRDPAVFYMDYLVWKNNKPQQMHLF